MPDLDSATEVTQAPKRRGRPPGKVKTRKRHDPAPAPVDGDYAPLDIVGKEKGFEYFAFSNWERQRRGHRYEVVRWAPDCAHPPWEVYTEDKKGQEVKINGQLTLMRIPTARIEAFRKRERQSYEAVRSGVTVEKQREMGHEVQRPTRHVLPGEIDVSGIYTT